MYLGKMPPDNCPVPRTIPQSIAWIKPHINYNKRWLAPAPIKYMIGIKCFAQGITSIKESEQQRILYIQRSSDSAVTGPVGIHYDSISDPTLYTQGGQWDHTVRVWQACKLQQDSNRTVNHQLTWYFDPSILAGVPTMDRSTVPRPRPLYWWTHSLKIKISICDI
jgi:hypothetical protein